MNSKHGKILIVFLILLFLVMPATSAEVDEDRLRYISVSEYVMKMGFEGIPIDDEFARTFGISVNHGILLAPFSMPFEFEIAKHGLPLAAWDIIVECNGEKVKDLPDLLPSGDDPEMEITVYRTGEFINLKLPVPKKMDMDSLGRIEVEEDDDMFSSSPFPLDENIVVVYYPYGEDPWDDHTLLETGDGAISGTLSVNGEPVEGVNISVLLKGSKRTQPATTDSDGQFEVHLPPGRYSYVGYAISGQNAPSRDLIPVNKNLANDLSYDSGPEATGADSGEMAKRLEELTDIHGPEKAAEMLAEEYKFDLRDPFEDKYVLDVEAFSTVTIPDIVYMDPVKIVSPMNNSSLSLDRVSFAWVPYKGAFFYTVSIYHIEKKSRSVIYHPICEQVVNGNSIDGAELDLESHYHYDEGDVVGFVPGEWYGVQVFAYDSNGGLLSASSYKHQKIEFKIK